MLLQRANNQQGRDLIQRYLTKGFINTNDVQAVVKQYPTEQEPLWQGRIPLPIPVATPVSRRENPTSRAASKTPATNGPNAATPTPTPTPTRPLPDTGILQKDLWQLSVAHAAQGILDFFGMATQPAQRMGIPVGAVFFPNGNQ